MVFKLANTSKVMRVGILEFSCKQGIIAPINMIHTDPKEEIQSWLNFPFRISMNHINRCYYTLLTIEFKNSKSRCRISYQNWLTFCCYNLPLNRDRVWSECDSTNCLSLNFDRIIVKWFEFCICGKKIIRKLPFFGLL